MPSDFFLREVWQGNPETNPSPHAPKDEEGPVLYIPYDVSENLSVDPEAFAEMTAPFNVEDGPVLAQGNGSPFGPPLEIESSKYPPLPAVATADDWLQPVAYVSGPYRDPRGTYYVEQNIRAAEAVAVELWRMGFAVICPHTNTRHMDGICPSSSDVFIRGDLEMVRRSDVVVMLPGWWYSVGARNEQAAAHAAGVLVLYWDKQRAHLERLGRCGRSCIPFLRSPQVN